MWGSRNRRRDGRETGALCKGKVVSLHLGGRTAAGLFFLVDHCVQIAVLKHHALAGLHAIHAAVEDAGDQNVGRVTAWIIDAGVAPLSEADFDVGRTGSSDENAEVGCEEMSALRLVAKLASIAP